ncbi:hypothetical protein PCE1_004448 [Barthelona sp. PCE]
MKYDTNTCVDVNELKTKFYLCTPNDSETRENLSLQTPLMPKLFASGLAYGVNNLETLKGNDCYIFTTYDYDADFLCFEKHYYLHCIAELQQIMDVPVFIQMTNVEYVDEYSRAKQFLSKLGFDPTKTFFYDANRHIATIYAYVCEIGKYTVIGDSLKTCGFTATTRLDNFGDIMPQMVGLCPRFFAPLVAELSEGAIDVAVSKCLALLPVDSTHLYTLFPSEQFGAPAVVSIKPIPSLAGLSTPPTDQPARTLQYGLTEKKITKKINKLAFSGGGRTLEEHQEQGGNVDIDVPMYLLFLLYCDDVSMLVTLDELRGQYAAGQLKTGDLKKRTAAAIHEYIKTVIME